MLVRFDVQLVDQLGVPVGRLDLVPVEVADEAAVVGLAIVRARPGRAVRAGAGLQGGVVEGVHGLLVRGDEAEVGAVADIRGLAVDRCLHPELRVFTAPGDGAGVFEDALAAEGRKDLVVEGHGPFELVGADGDVREDARILFGHGDLPWDCGSPKPSKGAEDFLSSGSTAVAVLGRLLAAQHEAAEQHHGGEQLEEAVDDVQQQAADRIGLLAEQLQGPVVQQPQRHDHQQHAGEQRPEVADAEQEAFAHRRQRCQAAQHQQVFGEGQLDHQVQGYRQKQRAAEHDQQGAQPGQYGERRPQRQRGGQQVAGGRALALATRVEEEDQRGAVQRVEEQPDQQLVGGRMVRIDQARDDRARQTLGGNQRQAQRGDAGQVTAEEMKGIAQNGQRIHRQASRQYYMTSL